MIADLDVLADQFEESPLHGDGGEDAATQLDAWNHAIDKLLEIRSLTDDWDGEGAPAPECKLVDSAIRLAGWMQGKDMRPPSRIVAGPTGTVVFEWQSDTGETLLDVEVTAPNKGELALFRKGRPTVHRTL